MQGTTLLLLLAIVLVAAVIVFAVLRRAGCPCQFCDNARTTPFARLPAALRREVLQYFAGIEHRSPRTDGIFVCLDCGTVYDDFSGERLSRDRDFVWPVMVCRAFCKVCNAMLQGCEPDAPSVACTHCGAEHAWRPHGPTGLRYLTCLSDRPVLKRCDDYTMGRA